MEIGTKVRFKKIQPEIGQSHVYTAIEADLDFEITEISNDGLYSVKAIRRPRHLLGLIYKVEEFEYFSYRFETLKRPCKQLRFSFMEE